MQPDTPSPPPPPPPPPLPPPQNITALTGQQQMPIVDLIPPMDTQGLALSYYTNDSKFLTF